MTTWIQEYKCGCNAEARSRKKLLGYCAKHGDDAKNTYRMEEGSDLFAAKMEAQQLRAHLAAARAENQALRNAMNDMLASAMASADVICEWKETQDGESWETSCEDEFIIIDGSPSENGLKFCPYCGKHLVVKAPEPESKED